MAIDNLALETVANNLSSEMNGAFFDHPFGLSQDCFAFPYHSGANTENKGRGTFIISLSPSNPFVCYSLDKFSKIDINTPFFNALRPFIGCRIASISKLVGERIIIVEASLEDKNIQTLNTSYSLIVELFPQRPNAYIIPHPSNKVSAVYKESGNVLGERYISRGLPYIFPLAREPLTSSVSSLESAKSYLSRSTSKLFEAYVDKIGFSKAFDDMLTSKSIYVIGKNIEPFSFGIKEAKKIETKDIYSFYVQDQKALAKQINESELNEKITKQVKVSQKKIENLEADLASAKSHLKFMEYGQELFLHQTEYVKGMASMDLDGIHIPLNSEIGIIENANAYFKKYHKAKSAIEIITPLIIQTEAEVTYLKSVLLNIVKGSQQDIMQLKQELLLDGYIKNKNANPSKKSRSISTKAEPHYLVNSEYKIGYGMNAFQNETLTFEIARKDNIFLHVFNYPGSHVVILQGDSDSTRLLAAELALYLSDLKEGDVMIAPRKDVKKNKEKRGLVSLLQYKLITIKKIREESLKLFDEKTKA